MRFAAVKIVTIDTDVAVLALYFQLNLACKIYLEMGKGRKTALFDISSNTMNAQVKLVLPSLHALPGCHPSISFLDFSKIKCIKIFDSDDRFLDAAKLLREDIKSDN